MLATALAPLLVGAASSGGGIGQRADALPVDAPRLDGAVAFKLHDTYGFPIDLTVELAAESGVAVDRAGFDRALAAQRERSRGGKKSALAEQAIGTARFEELLRAHGETRFVGYEQLEARSRVLALLRDGVEVPSLAPGETGEAIVDVTPCYAERGGQVGDQAVIRAGGAIVGHVVDTQRPVGALTVHAVSASAAIAVGDTVDIAVDAPRRDRKSTRLNSSH